MYLSGLVSIYWHQTHIRYQTHLRSIRDVVDWKLKWKNDNERSITEMRVDEAVIIGKREWTNGADNDVIFEGVATGCSRLFRLLVWQRNGIGEDRMTIGKETTTFSDWSNQTFSAAKYHCWTAPLRNEIITLPFPASYFPLFIPKVLYISVYFFLSRFFLYYCYTKYWNKEQNYIYRFSYLILFQKKKKSRYLIYSSKSKKIHLSFVPCLL